MSDGRSRGARFSSSARASNPIDVSRTSTVDSGMSSLSDVSDFVRQARYRNQQGPPPVSPPSRVQYKPQRANPIKSPSPHVMRSFKEEGSSVGGGSSMKESIPGVSVVSGSSLQNKFDVDCPRKAPMMAFDDASTLASEATNPHLTAEQKAWAGIEKVLGDGESVSVATRDVLPEAVIHALMAESSHSAHTTTAHSESTLMKALAAIDTEDSSESDLNNENLMKLMCGGRNNAPQDMPSLLGASFSSLATEQTGMTMQTTSPANVCIQEEESEHGAGDALDSFMGNLTAQVKQNSKPSATAAAGEPDLFGIFNWGKQAAAAGARIGQKEEEKAADTLPSAPNLDDDEPSIDYEYEDQDCMPGDVDEDVEENFYEEQEAAEEPAPAVEEPSSSCSEEPDFFGDTILAAHGHKPTKEAKPKAATDADDYSLTSTDMRAIHNLISMLPGPAPGPPEDELSNSMPSLATMKTLDLSPKKLSRSASMGGQSIVSQDTWTEIQSAQQDSGNALLEGFFSELQQEQSAHVRRDVQPVPDPALVHPREAEQTQAVEKTKKPTKLRKNGSRDGSRDRGSRDEAPLRKSERKKSNMRKSRKDEGSGDRPRTRSSSRDAPRVRGTSRDAPRSEVRRRPSGEPRRPSEPRQRRPSGEPRQRRPSGEPRRPSEPPRPENRRPSEPPLSKNRRPSESGARKSDNRRPSEPRQRPKFEKSHSRDLDKSQDKSNSGRRMRRLSNNPNNRSSSNLSAGVTSKASSQHDSKAGEQEAPRRKKRLTKQSSKKDLQKKRQQQPKKQPQPEAAPVVVHKPDDFSSFFKKQESAPSLSSTSDHNQPFRRGGKDKDRRGSLSRRSSAIESSSHNRPTLLSHILPNRRKNSNTGNGKFFSLPFFGGKPRRGSPASVVETGRQESEFFPDDTVREEDWGELLAAH